LFYKVVNGGHDWPGAWGNKDINTSEEIWHFFEKYLKE
jgi:polyhydroxybutyrate depolymerase